MKLDGIFNKAKANKKDTTIDWLSIKDRLENRIGFAKEMIGYSFRKNGNTDEDISPVFTKDSLNVRAETIDMVAKKIAPYLVLSVLPNTNDRKRENTKNTNRIITLLNQNLPPLEGDKTIQIGISFMKYGETIPYRNVMLTVGSCDKLSNAETIAFKNETELLLKFREILLEEDPEIITGYNIDGFDTTWLFKRAQELEIYEDFADIGRFRGLISQLKEKQVKSPVGELVKKEYVDIAGRIQLDILPQVQKGYQLESYKLDDVSTHFINGSIKDLVYDPATGETVITTDSVKNLNENNYIMFSYSDEHETNRYNDGEKFEVYRLERDAISKFNDKKGKIEKLSTFRVKSKLDLDIKKYRCNWALGKDDVSPNDIFRLQKGSSADRYIIAKYCMMDVILCLELLLKLELITNSIGMANVCLNPLSWIIHRGQGVKILSLVAYFIKQKNYLLPFLYKDSFDRDGYEGAVVLDPNPKIYLDDEPISVLDYGSLYPSSMREKNISHETIVTNEKFLGEEGAKLLDQMGYDIEDVQYDIFKTIFNSNGNKKDKIKIGVKTVRYVQYRDGTKGIIPQILEYLVNARKTTRNKITYRSITTKSGQSYIGNIIEKGGSIKIKTDKETIDITNDPVVTNEETYNKFQQNVLDGLQLAFKVTANSLYGQVGAKTSDIYYKELAASTTSVGRNCLMIAKEYVENPDNYPQVLKDGTTVYLNNKVIYGDTDSVFVKFQCIGDDGQLLRGRDARIRSIKLGIQTDEAIQRTKLKEPQVLEYEKTFHPFILFTKKRYVGNLYEHDPDSFKRKSMGIVLKRRDNAPIVKIIYAGILDIIMKQNDIRASATFLRKTLRELIDGKFGLDKLVITKTLSSYYKDPEKIAHRVLADRIAERDPGNKPQVNERIPFIYFDTSKIKTDRKLLQGEKIETPDYIKSNKLLPDYETYINNQIKKPVTQIFALCLDQIPNFKGDLSEYDKMFKSLISSGVNRNTAIKKVLEAKRKVAEQLLFGDILRVLENKRKGNNDISQFFRK
jgi:DNA polymerase elongation subunit (family B)